STRGSEGTGSTRIAGSPCARLLTGGATGLRCGRMKLAIKLTIALVVGIVVVMGVYAAVPGEHEGVLSESGAHCARRDGLAWLGAIESVWGREGEARARELMDLSVRRAGPGLGVLRVVSLAPDAPSRPRLSPEEIRSLEAGNIVRRVIPDGDGE